MGYAENITTGVLH